MEKFTGKVWVLENLDDDKSPAYSQLRKQG